jgi:ribosomal protein S18 acetylase RimI-like enzyme
LTISYSLKPNPSAIETQELFDVASFPDATGRFDTGQIENMLSYANIIVVARDVGNLVGIALSMTNFSSVCFLVALAVHPDYQGQGVGKTLISDTRLETGGGKISFVTVSTPNAVGFYEGVGMEHCNNAFIIPRDR